MTLVRADGKDTRWYLATKDGARHRFVPVALDPVFVKPTLFALPATVAAPVCVETARGATYILMYTRSAGATGDEAVLTLESLGASPSVVPLAKATLATTDPDDAILATIDRDRRIEVAAKLGDTKACALTTLGANAAFTADGVAYTLKQDGGRWAVARADHAALLPLASAHGTPRWAMGTALFFAAESGHGWTRTRFEPSGWDRLPDPPEAAAKAPKLLGGKVPGHAPAQKRCLAWNSKDRATWIVRPAGDCTTADGTPCTPSAILTEVRKEASYKRVTLAKNGASTPAALAQADTLLAKADLGCVDGQDATILGVPVKVSLEADQVMVEANGKKQRVDWIIDRHDDGNDLTEAFENVFWHPDVNVLVLEVRQDSTNWRDRRYLWVDLGRFGIQPTK